MSRLDYPIVEGRYRLTSDWELELPEKFNRRIEDGSMVLWRPGLTLRMSVWEPLPEVTPERTLSWILKDASPDRMDEKIDRSGGILRLSYRLRERDPERDPQEYVSISGHAIAPSGLVMISAYCDNAEAESTGSKVIGSIRLSDDEERAKELMTKVFKIPAEQIRQLAPDRGGCIASDRITVDGARVGFMYRDEPANDLDSGWRMMAGDESEDYMDEPSNHAVYDVNTIANYDPDIVPLLDAPVGAQYERSDEGPFVEVSAIN